MTFSKGIKGFLIQNLFFYILDESTEEDYDEVYHCL